MFVGVHHIFQHGHARGVRAQGSSIRQCRAAHGAEHTAREVKARQLRKHLELSRVDRDIVRAARKDLARLPFYVAALHQK